jgi:hypothetical protein
MSDTSRPREHRTGLAAAFAAELAALPTAAAWDLWRRLRIELDSAERRPGADTHLGPASAR